MDGFSALRACVAQLSAVVDAVERISDTCVMTPEEAASLSHVFVPGSRFNSRTLSHSLKATDSAMRRRMLTLVRSVVSVLALSTTVGPV